MIVPFFQFYVFSERSLCSLWLVFLTAEVSEKAQSSRRTKIYFGCN
jgi:hypothetical protein